MPSTNHIAPVIDKLQLFYGKPISFGDICLIYPPTLGTIADIGLTTFFQYMSMITINKEKYEHITKEMSEIVYLIGSSLVDLQAQDLIKKAFLFFTKESIVLLPDLKKIHIGEKLSEERFLTEDNFSLFQSYIKQLCVFDSSGYDIRDSDSEKVKQLKEKIRKGQELVNRYKKSSEKDEGPELIDLISSFLCKGNGVNYETIWKMSYYAFQMQFRRMQMAEEYDINLRSALAGAKISKDKMKYWIRKIQD